MNIAIDLPDDVAAIVAAQPDRQGFLIDAIRRESDRRGTLVQLMQLAERISTRFSGTSDAELEALVRD
jgi:hypothetical protein